jgi:hypothetical protein
MGILIPGSFRHPASDRAALSRHRPPVLLFIVLGFLCSTLVEASDTTPRYRVVTNVDKRVEAVAFGHDKSAPTKTVSDAETSEQTGNEPSVCTNSVVRRSVARATARATSKIGGAELAELSVEAYANGGGYRRCVACIVTCVGFLDPRDTTATASARASSESKIEFFGSQKRTSFRITATSALMGSARFEVVLLDKEGNVVARGDSTIDTTVQVHQATYFVFRASLVSNASDVGTCCNKQVAGTARISLKTVEVAEAINSTETPSIREGRVAGGSVELRWNQVGLVSLYAGRKWCSGTVIGSQTVLTAAHCVDGVNKGQIEFVVADTREGQRPENTYEIESLMYPVDAASGYAYDKLIFADDVAVLFTTRRIVDPTDPKMERLLSPIPLYNGTPSTMEQLHQRAEQLLFVGFGHSDAGPLEAKPQSGGAGVRRSVLMPIRDFGRKTFMNRSPGQNTCQGDSGGAVLLLEATDKARIVGIVSSGDRECKDYGFNTRVDAYFSWLSQRIR